MDRNDHRFCQLRAITSTEFNSVIEDLRSQINTLRETQQAQIARILYRPNTSLPDPEKFTGNAVKFDTWITSIQAKLSIDGEAIGNSKAQFFYVYFNLDSTVQAMILPQVAHANSVNIYDYQAILDQLTHVYMTPNMF
ncbi:hypothetical protein N7478_007633 [Penicillium angulare]|uniref:uncharacterized protein n=1 Tax=Penicillium angulare TaxID=116970 RepID=UPI00253F8129|nr:uncharacterized protein N7478_007633 [Penicillium angulare]KAJ5272508.1 hypothetical protein N7478_007633 [Penicillium angulare]